MAGVLFERFGFAVDASPAPAGYVAARQGLQCPFISDTCKKHKSGGVCSITPTELKRPVIICPNRLYERQHRFLREIAVDAFVASQPSAYNLDPEGLPILHRGNQVVAAAAASGLIEIGAFGGTLGSEIKLPPAVAGGASYSVDFVLVAATPEGDLQGFVPIEVQTIDTTNNYKAAVADHEATGAITQSGVGLNWENVSKRILPQLITKGLMLQGERLCTHGMFFVTPSPVFDKIATRLGGIQSLRQIPMQPGSITFSRYDVDQATQASPLLLTRDGSITISTSDMSLAFISPRNLPPAGSYESKIKSRLGI